MSSFIPHYYNNYYFQNYYNAVQQRDKYRYDREYQRPQPHYGSYYQTQPRYQTSFFANPAYSSTHFNQYDVNRSALAYANQYDDRYRPRHTWPYLDHGHQRKAWKYPDSALPLSNYSRRYSSIDDDGQVYQFEREIRFIPYPVYVRPGGSAITSSAYLGYHNPVGHQFPLWTNTSYPIRSNASQLTPKIRVIFIPPPATFQPPACPPSLCMPPFLFNRMAQPFCSLPVPPPLPQISSLPLSLGVQQRVMQQYANPVAVLPWNNAWSSAISQPPMMPMFQMPQIPQIPQQPMMLMPPLPSQYTPAVSFPQFQPLPAPAPIPQYQPMPAAAPIQPIYPSPIAPASQPAAGAYPDICRACIPAPPPLNISVNGHCWVQHCSACHLVPGDVSNPNARPPTGRMTPLLRQPTALPNASHGNQGAAASHAGHVNGLPPLPPGAVLISDEYIDRNAAQPSRPRPSLQQASYSYTAPHPSKVSTYSTHKSRGQAPVQPPNHVVKPSPPSSAQQSRGTSQVIMSAAPLTLSANRHHSVSPSSSYTSGTSSSQTPVHVHGAPAEPNPAEKERKIVFRQVGASTRTVNVQYRHQTPDVHSIYQSNEQSTSVESDGTANELSRSGSSFASHERSTPRNRSPSVPLASSEEHEGEEKLAADESSAPASTKQARSYLTAVYNVQSLSLWNDGSDLADAATTNEDQARAVVEDVVDSD